ncbi:6-hydroxymethylpterin diphosphokinase MptE-like protein [Lederbergia panacisoli]|uniref:6-hydroxymethylpterin diphosphokinase MptE-like protein n=1 Tax=Lederbergia panacisoli TaxID=1255251 RepID=UPI00214B9525|nr:6-hydroxymethylpterin diphosphokinase MptE-like protein [Lederbergia panacisoli]MCR2822018.1 DUF115 domain-containing protein [Lederbergia panacisoli]
MSIKKTLQHNKYTSFLIGKVRELQYQIIPSVIFGFLFNVKKFLRLYHVTQKSPYEKLKLIKDKHKGERCFIVATGPSLKIQDLEKLHKEVTFSMNSVCLAFDETEWRPTYYGIQDKGVYKKLESYIKNFNAECKFIGDSISIHNNIPKDYYIFPLNLLNHSFSHKKYNTKFSDNAFAEIYDGYTITYSLIQIAVYMGVKEIYLLGADCNYSSDMNHHFKDYGHVDPTFLSSRDKMISAYKVAKTYADQNNIKIFNATRGGVLEVFDRVDFDSLFKVTS